MKKTTLITAIICAAALLFAGCGNSSAAPETPVQPSSATESAAGTESKENATEENSSDKAVSDAKSIAVYFSRVGNTDFPEGVDAISSASLQLDDGNIKGNAQLIAEWIADEAGCEIFEIVSEEDYPVDYDQTVDQARNEQSDGVRPSLKSTLEEPEQYDTIYLAFPNWWADLPMPVYSFFDEYDFSGKTIAVFITHEGSRFSHTIDTIRELEPDAEIVEGLAVRGGTVKDEEQNIRKWVQEN